MKINRVKDSIWAVVGKFLAIPIVWADQKFDRTSLLKEKNSYCTLKLLSGPLKNGMDSEILNGTKMESFGNREITISINIYGQDAVFLMSNLHDLIMTSVFRHSLHFEAVQYGLEIAIIETPNVINLTQLMQTNFEERSQLDFRIRVVSKTSFDVELIESVSSDINSGYDRYENDPNRINDDLTI